MSGTSKKVLVSRRYVEKAPKSKQKNTNKDAKYDVEEVLRVMMEHGMLSADLADKIREKTQTSNKIDHWTNDLIKDESRSSNTPSSLSYYKSFIDPAAETAALQHVTSTNDRLKASAVERMKIALKWPYDDDNGKL